MAPRFSVRIFPCRRGDTYRIAVEVGALRYHGEIPWCDPGAVEALAWAIADQLERKSAVADKASPGAENDDATATQGRPRSRIA